MEISKRKFGNLLIIFLLVNSTITFSQYTFSPSSAKLGESKKITISVPQLLISDDPNCQCPNCHYVSTSNVVLRHHNQNYGTFTYIYPTQIDVIENSTIEAYFDFDASHPVGEFLLLLGYQTSCQLTNGQIFILKPSFSISPNVLVSDTSLTVTFTGLGVEFDQVSEACASYWNANGGFENLSLYAYNILLFGNGSYIHADTIENLVFNYNNNNNYDSQFDAHFTMPSNDAYGNYTIRIDPGGCGIWQHNAFLYYEDCNADFNYQIENFGINLSLEDEIYDRDGFSILFDMGDGNIVQAFDDLTYTYSLPGTYDITCYQNFQSNYYSCADTVVKTITVSCSNLNIETSFDDSVHYYFDNIFPTNEYSILWDFDNGDIAENTLSGYYQYDYFGAYALSLKLTNYSDTNYFCKFTDTIYYYPFESNSSVTVKPNASEGKDAMIANNQENTNFGSSANLNIYSQLINSVEYYNRILIQFDIPEICSENYISNENITSAKIKLYYNPLSNNGFNGGENYDHTYTRVRRITAPWDEDIATWANQPAYEESTNFETPIEETDGPAYFDVTDLVKDINLSPNENFGFLIKASNLLQFYWYSRGVFASSDHYNSDLHPELTINYTNLPPSAGLPEAIFSCPDDTTTLIALDGYLSYQWSTGETGTTIQASDTGYYTLQYTDFHGTTFIDSVHVISEEMNLYETIDTTFEIGTFITLDAGENFTSYVWNDSTNSQFKIITKNENLSVSLLTEFGCNVSKDYHAKLQQTIELFTGWSIISTCINPEQPNFDSIFSELDYLTIVKNQLGLVYYPSFSIDQIGNHVVGEGYQIKMEASETLKIVGAFVSPENTQINLNSGWNIIAYIDHKPSPIQSAFAEMINDIEIVKNDDGQVFWPAYAINLIGNLMPTEGYQIKLSTSQNFNYPYNCTGYIIDERDAQTYEMVQIGNQCWMAENLNVGEWIMSNNSGQSTNQIIEKYCYVDDANNCELYGGLYKWNELMQNSTQESVQGICPDGWHIPSDNEWYIMENFVDSAINDSTLEGWRGVSAGIDLGFGGSTNFEAIGKGYFHISYYDFSSSYFFTSSEKNTNSAYIRSLSPSFTNSYRSGFDKNAALSIRCIRD